MQDQIFRVERRQHIGSAAARRLRCEAKVPCVLYGHGEEIVPLAISASDLDTLLEGGQHVVTLDVEGKKQSALVREVQHDTWGKEILHVDFGRISLDEIVKVSVQVVSHGSPKAVLSGSALLEQPLHNIELECRANAIPSEIRVETGEMAIGQMIHVRDLPLPAGTRATIDPEAIVFVVHEAREQEVVAAPAEAEAATPAEPELIKRPAKEEEPEDEKKS